MEVESRTILEKFYDSFEVVSPVKILILMVCSFGLYFINWIYLTNLKFEKFDFENSPSSKRGLVVMFLIPFFWILVFGVFRKILFREFVDVLFWIDFIGWFGIIFLLLHYLFDFCRCFGRFTLSNGFVWYMFLWIGFFPLLLLPFELYYFLSILFFPIISIPAMQAKLNLEKSKFDRFGKTRRYYKVFGTRK